MVDILIYRQSYRERVLFMLENRARLNEMISDPYVRTLLFMIADNIKPLAAARVREITSNVDCTLYLSIAHCLTCLPKISAVEGL